MHEKTAPPVDATSDRIAAGSDPQDDAVAEEVHELVWAMIDDRITAEQIERLDQLVIRDPRARAAYTQCMHLHADLWSLFASPPDTEIGNAPQPVPPLVTGSLSGLEMRPPVPDA